MSGRAVLEWQCARRPAPDERVCGDRAAVVSRGGRTLIVVVDGLGHGEEAARAADAAVAALDDGAGGDALTALGRCHEALRETRGAAVSAAAFDPREGTLTWAGVGNVEGRLVRAGRGLTESLLTLGGIVGRNLPPLRAMSVPVERGDMLLLATDGLTATFGDDLEPSGSCSAIARRLLDAFGRPTDDALVVVARFLWEDT